MVNEVRKEDVPEMWKHQVLTYEKFNKLNYGAIFHEAGAGKTRTVLEIYRAKCRQEAKHLRTIIFAPPVVLENWRREILRFTRLKPTQVFVLKGTGKKRTAKFSQEAWIRRNHDQKGNPYEYIQNVVFIMNYECLLMYPLRELMMKWEPEFLIFDESHKCKNVSSKRTKYAIKLAELAKYRFLLTGTPILNSSMDLFAQFRIMDLGRTFGKNVFFFRNEYFHDKNAGMPKEKYFPNWVPRPDTYERLNDKIKPLTSVVKKKDCMDLPPLIKQIIPIEMTANQTTAYNSMRKNFIAYVNGDACVAELALTKGLRLMQICSGFVTVEKENGTTDVVTYKQDPRAEALKDLLEDITPNDKVLVWAVWHENYKKIREVCEKVGVGYVELHGGVKDKQASIDTFTNDESCRVLIGHPGSGGIGVNLVNASYSIFYSRNFSLEYDIQAEARNYRGGSEQHEKITRIDLVAQNTLDEVIAERLAEKQEIGTEILKQVSRLI